MATRYDAEGGRTKAPRKEPAMRQGTGIKKEAVRFFLESGRMNELVPFGAEMVPCLFQIADDPREGQTTRGSAIFTLGRLGSQNLGASRPIILSMMVSALEADNPLTRMDAALAIGRICDPTAAAALMKALRSPREVPEVKVKVVAALGMLAEKHPGMSWSVAVNDVAYAMYGDYALLRAAAAQTLVKFGIHAIGRLVEELKSRNHDIRGEAFIALKKLALQHPARVMSELAEVLGDELEAPEKFDLGNHTPNFTAAYLMERCREIKEDKNGMAKAAE